jgi:transcription elongation factor GreA
MKREPFTPKGLVQAKAHLKYLKEVERPNIIIAIAEARAHGDLSENAEYHAAKDRQGFIEAEIRVLESVVGRAEVVNLMNMEPDRVVFGATVTVYDSDRDEELTYQIVNTVVADTSLNKISYEAPISRSLIGKEDGDEVKVRLPGGVRTLEILEISYD